MSVKSADCSDSQAIVLYRPPQTSEKFVRSELERKTDQVYKRSMEQLKFETQRLIAPRHFDVLPYLTGPYSVGYSSSVIEGPKKTLSEGNHEIGIEIYVPTKSNGNRLRLELTDSHWAKEQLSAEQLQTLYTLYTHSIDTLDPIGKMPILIFSHGLGVPPFEYRRLLEEIASHGFIVLSLNHPSSSGYAPFSPDALDIHSLESFDFSDPKALLELASAQEVNIRFVLDKIRKGELKELPKNLGFVDQIVLAGHSLGGAASVIVSRKDSLIAGCINLDGGLVEDPETRTKGLSIPILTLLSDPPEPNPDIIQDWEAFHNHCKTSTKKKIDGISHMDFAISPILSWLLGDSSADRCLKTHQIASQEMLKFMHSIFG